MGRGAERSIRTAATYGTDAAKAGYRAIRSKDSILRRRAEQKMAGEEVVHETSAIRTREVVLRSQRIRSKSRPAFASRRQRVARPISSIGMQMERAIMSGLLRGAMEEQFIALKAIEVIQ